MQTYLVMSDYQWGKGPSIAAARKNAGIEPQEYYRAYGFDCPEADVWVDIRGCIHWKGEQEQPQDCGTFYEGKLTKGGAA